MFLPGGETVSVGIDIVGEVGVASKFAGGESEESIVTAVVSTETTFTPLTAVARITLTSFAIEGR